MNTNGAIVNDSDNTTGKTKRHHRVYVMNLNIRSLIPPPPMTN
jgi:hypothetical protein